MLSFSFPLLYSFGFPYAKPYFQHFLRCAFNNIGEWHLIITGAVALCLTWMFFGKYVYDKHYFKFDIAELNSIPLWISAYLAGGLIVVFYKDPRIKLAVESIIIAPIFSQLLLGAFWCSKQADENTTEENTILVAIYAALLFASNLLLIKDYAAKTFIHNILPILANAIYFGIFLPSVSLYYQRVDYAIFLHALANLILSIPIK